MNRKQFFDKLAESWDTSTGFKKTQKIIKCEIFPLLKKFIKKSDIVLDLGCGTGILLPYLKNLVGKDGKVYALDFSDKMLKKAQEKFGDEFVYVKANAHSMPFKKKMFNCVVCFNTFPHFVNKLKVLKEVSCILKPRGYFIIAHSGNKKEMNNYHRKVKGPVRNDFLPEEEKIFSWFKKTKFSVEEFIEKDKIYFLIAKMNFK